jgi:hypothetical protein
MENINPLDAIMGGLAIAIALGGLVMLFSGIFASQDKP